MLPLCKKEPRTNAASNYLCYLDFSWLILLVFITDKRIKSTLNSSLSSFNSYRSLNDSDWKGTQIFAHHIFTFYFIYMYIYLVVVILVLKVKANYPEIFEGCPNLWIPQYLFVAVGVLTHRIQYQQDNSIIYIFRSGSKKSSTTEASNRDYWT